MKKTYFLVAIFTCIQLTLAGQKAQATPQQGDEIEESIEEIGEEVEEALESLAESFGESADRVGEHLEQWAEEHAGELEHWQEKYAEEWESWAEGLERKMERFADKQDKIWNEWAQRYENSWQRWGEELESEEIDSEIVGQLMKRNLKMLSEMPLGQMVDGLLEGGLGELSNAPWESLEELGDLAHRALEEPMAELAERNRERDLRESRGLRSREPRRNREAAIRARIQTEQLRHAETLRAFNDDLRRTSEQSRAAEAKRREMESRKPRRVDGKPLDAESKRRRVRRSSTDRKGRSKAKESESGKAAISEIRMLRREMEMLKRELRELKNSKDD